MPRSPQVHKFGGASLATAEAMAHAVTIVLAHRPGPIVVVVSALAGVTDALLDIANKGLRGGATALRRKHRAIARAILTGARRKDLISRVDEVFAELKVRRRMTPPARDSLVARGEQLSARLFAAALEPAGCPVEYVSATHLILTDDRLRHASVHLARTERAIRKSVGRLLARGVVAVVPGFIGATQH